MRGPFLKLPLVFAAFGLSAALVGSVAAAPLTSSPAAVKSASSDPADLQSRINRLIEQLGDARFPVREQAQEALSRIGPDAFDALCEAQAHDDIEIASRARYLVQRIRVDWTQDGDLPKVKQLLQDYDVRSDAERQLAMQTLAASVRELGVEPLCRIVRFEKSTPLSKQCAILIMELNQASLPNRDWNTQAKIIEQTLKGSVRPAARWLLAYLRLRSDPEANLDPWTKLVAEETVTLEKANGDTAIDIVLALERRQVEALLKLEHNSEAVEVMRKMIAMDQGDPKSLAQVVDWLTKLQAWELINEVATRFDAAFKTNATLLYRLAQARQLQGNSAEAESLAKQAWQMNPGDDLQHAASADDLRKRLLFKWSEREYRHLLRSQNAPYANEARRVLAEFLHDQGRDLAAAKLQEEYVNSLTARMPNPQRPNPFFVEPTSPELMCSKMHYFYACHYAAQKDVAQQQQHLDQAIALNPEDPDIMIDLYRTSADDPLRRKKAVEMIQNLAQTLDDKIKGQPDDATFYNEYAWLIGNTEGDLDLAIQYSQKSLELDPDRAGLIDTLAHCYATKGDYDKAVTYQSQAAELEPYTLTIVRALDEFKAKQEKSQNKNN
jgi:tetratricopeptide (TPR) repeat protein